MNQLNVIGLGIREAAQLTLESLEVLKRSEKILILPIVSPQVEAFLQQQGLTDFENLKALYTDGTQDEVNYERLYSKVVAECDLHSSVALLVPGHPRIGVTLVQWLEQRQASQNFTLAVYEGISSFATLINDLKKDPIEKGSVILDANRILLFEYPLNAMLDHYIYHTCSVGRSEVNLNEPTRGNRIDLLQEHLLDFFPGDHRVTLISSSLSPIRKQAEEISFPLSDLTSMLPLIHYGSTLFIPGLKPRKINRKFLVSLTPELT